MPTRNEKLLRAAIGQTIQSMVHYADGEPDSVLASTAYALRNVAAHQLFSLADGDVVVRFGNGQALSFGGSEELASITIERADGDALQEDGWLDAEEPPFRDFHVWIAARLGFSSRDGRTCCSNAPAMRAQRLTASSSNWTPFDAVLEGSHVAPRVLVGRGESEHA